MTLWKWFVAWLVSLSADPAAIDQEQPRAAAAVAVAYAGFATEAAPTPGPTPAPGKCCGECGGRGYIVHGDGHRTPCPCPASCPCKKGTACPDGKCGVPWASPATVSPAKPIGGR